MISQTRSTGNDDFRLFHFVANMSQYKIGSFVPVQFTVSDTPHELI